MAWTPVLLVLLSHCTGSLSQPVLTQPPSFSASPGASARLTCPLSSGFTVGGHWINWFQQKPGSPPRYLLSFYSDSNKHQGSGVPSRFPGSKDASANAGILLISGLPSEDAVPEGSETKTSVLSRPVAITPAGVCDQVQLRGDLCCQISCSTCFPWTSSPDNVTSFSSVQLLDRFVVHEFSQCSCFHRQKILTQR
ncbi:Immunoglobulin omega chain [Pteropus alecto]|nr:Immunoglobulin omega chain [Pteropus alecto]